MTPMLSLGKTPMQAIYETTCLELIRELSSGLIEDVPINESYTSVHGLNHSVEEINFSQAINDIMKKYHHPGLRRDHDGNNKGYSKWMEMMEIMKVGNLDMSINDAIKMTAEIRQSADTQLYGILLMDAGLKKKKVAFNPFHPVIVSELMKEETGIDRKEKVWTMAVFSWREKQETAYKKMYPHYYNDTDYSEEIATIIGAIDVPSQYIIENKDFNVDIENDQFVLKYKQIKKQKDSGDVIAQDSAESRSYIIPGQLINIGGVGFPYYNTIYSTKGLAWNMSPMYGANINHPQGQEDRRGMQGGSRICTNSGDSKTQKGIAALNHCNTTSPLNRDCMEAGSMTYANQCLDLSLELLLGNGYQATLPIKVLTFKEFVAENDGATKAQYIDYIKNRMKDKMAQKGQDEADEGETKLAETDLSEEIDYQNYNSERTYLKGEIVVDTTYPILQWNHDKGRLRRSNGDGTWDDYEPINEAPIPEPIPPITQVNIHTMGVFNRDEVRDWQGNVMYIPGDIVFDDGALRIRAEADDGMLWHNYNPPVVLDEIQPEHNEWIRGNQYHTGDRITLDGQIYITQRNTRISPRVEGQTAWIIVAAEGAA